MLTRAREAKDEALGFSTDPEEPLRQGRYQSPLRDERVAAILGASLGILFSVCFITGLYSHLHQHPLSWLPVPSRPAGLYRVSQGIHVACGIASLPVLLAKLWVVWPRFLSFPPVKKLQDLVERIGIFPLVAGGIFMVFSGIANMAQWYPWRFGFPAAHFWMAWVTMGALFAHIGAKWVIARRALRRPSRRPALSAADPVLSTSAEGDHFGLTRRGLLWTVAAAAGALTVATIGETVGPLRRLALLAPRDPQIGPQGYPVNRSAANAGVLKSSASPGYRLTVEGKVARHLSFTEAEFLALPSREAILPDRVRRRLELLGPLAGRSGAGAVEDGRRRSGGHGPRHIPRGQQPLQRRVSRPRSGARPNDASGHPSRRYAARSRSRVPGPAHRPRPGGRHPDQMDHQGGGGMTMTDKTTDKTTARTETRGGAVRFWLTAAIGWAIIAYGLRGMFHHRIDTRPANLARFAVGGALLHDLIFAPVVLVAGLLIARAVTGRSRAIVQAALIVSGCLALFSYPVVRGFGHAAHNPSSLPHNYTANLAIVIGVVWGIATICAVVVLRHHRDDAKEGGG